MSEKRPKLTPKEALAVLHKLEEVLGWRLYLPEATVEEQALRKQIWAAFSTLRLAIHGPAPSGTSLALCDVCYLCFAPLANPFVVLRDDPRSYKSPCTACLERLKAEGKLARIEDWKTGEVTLC